ncbi:HNH nuclease [metagenome]|uniref:HNH nuclease n=1 Tax=metagenome TaxID=256318 RepID=A0A2P2C9N0_9ZZZZ
MTAMASSEQQHVVTRAVASLRASLSGLAEVPLWSMGAAETASTLVEVTRLAAQVAELELRVAAHAERVGVEEPTGATSAAAWWAHAGHLTRREAHTKVRLAVALDTEHEPVRDALAAGDLVLEQAAVIVRAVEELPQGCDPEIVDRARAELVTLGRDHDAKALKVLGRRILDVIAPEVAEAHEARLLEAEEREALESARFTMTDDGHGRCHGRFTLPSAQGAMLLKALLGFAAPKHRAAVDGTAGERRPTPERMGRALCEYVERFPTDRLPSSGGVNATVVVTMDLATLLDGDHGTGVAALDTGESITAGQARRLACEAGIIPAVLGGTSQILDLGRTRRFHSKAQRIALGIRDKGCTAHGCETPPGLCHAHHDHPWSKHGGTSVQDGRLLCPRHHSYAHDPKYELTHLPGGKVAFTRRT